RLVLTLLLLSIFLFFLFLMILLHLTSTLFPYTTLFRSFSRMIFIPIQEYRDNNDEDLGNLAEYLTLRDDPFMLFLLFIPALGAIDRKSTRLNSSHVSISYAVFCLKKKNNL